MTIIHVASSIDLGGAENHMFDLIAAQKKHGHEVIVVYLRGNHHLKAAYTNIGVKTYHVDISSNFHFHKSLQIRNLILQHKADIIHAHMPPAELFTRLALIDLNIPLIISKHNDEPFAPFFGNLFFPNWVARRAQKIICISDAVLAYEKKVLNSSQHNKLQKIYYSININKFSEAKEPGDIDCKNKFTIGTVARLTKQKSLHTLLAAFKRFHEINPQSQLLIVGVGELEQELKNYSQNIGIDSAVVWLGKRFDVPSVMKCFDVFALTSIYEGFGLVLLEAMAAKIPVIASRVSAIPEVLNQGECGMLFSAQNEDELLSCLLKMQPDEVRNQYKQKGEERVQNFFTLSKMFEQTENVYQNAKLQAPITQTQSLNSLS